MANRYLVRGIFASVMALAVSLLVQVPISASHNWGGGTKGYHWMRSTNTIRNIPIRRFHSSIWLARYSAAYTKWRSASMTKVRPIQGATGGGRNPCPAALNQITSCDGSYGNTGWLGLATVWTYSGGHIAQGTSKVNNTYHNRAPYNTTAYRQFVICQEIGHNFGLGHVNEVFTNANTGSCMDYTNDPDGGPGGGSNSDPHNMNPNAHDYALINSKHNHVGSASHADDLPGILPGFADAEVMPAAAMAFNPMKLSDLGTLVHVGAGGRLERYERDFGSVKATSFVIRAK